LHTYNSQFSTGHSPAQSPLSPSSHAGDDYFSSRQASPGPASSPSGGSAKIKSRPRPSANGARVSQGGIKALFGQGGSKSNRASLDLKSDAALHLSQPQQGLTAAALIAAGQPSSGDLASPKTPPLRKKKASKVVSAEIPIQGQQTSLESSSSAGPSHPAGLSLLKGMPVAAVPAMPTLAERRAAAAAAAAAAGTQRGRSASESSPLAQHATLSEPLNSLIPPNLGLDSTVQKLVVSPNGTPAGDSATKNPLASPSILGSPASSPAPIQIGRATTTAGCYNGES